LWILFVGLSHVGAALLGPSALINSVIERRNRGALASPFIHAITIVLVTRLGMKIGFLIQD